MLISAKLLAQWIQHFDFRFDLLEWQGNQYKYWIQAVSAVLGLSQGLRMKCFALKLKDLWILWVITYWIKDILEPILGILVKLNLRLSFYVGL